MLKFLLNYNDYNNIIVNKKYSDIANPFLQNKYII